MGSAITASRPSAPRQACLQCFDVVLQCFYPLHRLSQEFFFRLGNRFSGEHAEGRGDMRQAFLILRSPRLQNFGSTSDSLNETGRLGDPKDRARDLARSSAAGGLLAIVPAVRI